MHNIKDIRKDIDNFKNTIKNRNVDVDFDQILNLDEENRKLIQEKEKLEMEKKSISKSKDETLFEKSKEISNKIDDLSKNQKNVKDQLDQILSNIPNLPLNDVPVGKDENSNKEVVKSGKIKEMSFKPKSHYEIGEKLNMLDFDLATKTTGSRFVFVKDKLASLERAISNFMIDTHVNNNGYTEISPPLMATDNTMFGTGQLPKFENDQFEIKFDDKNDRKFLIPTAEVILTNMVKNQILNLKSLPMRLVASTPCFRKEAGSYGKDTKGMIRQHQFYKVELVSIVENNKCIEELERMTNCATKILDDLQLPYRKIILSTGDMGFSAEKTYDIEVWLPSENKYREISSCSSCGTFQAKRMKARYKNNNNENEFVGTLNGRLVASTPCFRKEAGSYGKDTKGMIRQHQFYKVELVSIVENNKCIEELERMTNCATKILDDLQLPYRKIILSTGDMGFSAEKTYDIEVWLPSENKYREISSCSSCGTFQAKRMKARYKNNNNENEFVGTLNGSGLAVGRTLIAILENYQTEDGSIIIPEKLRPYMNNMEKIGIN